MRWSQSRSWWNHMARAIAGIVLALSGLPVLAAVCPQIAGWSNQDASFFPVVRSTRIDHNNTPGRFYFTMNSEQEKTLLVTYFTMVAGPSSGLTKDRLFSNSVSVGLYSFGSAADASGMFNREVSSFYSINPVRWGYLMLVTGPGVLSYYSDKPGEKEINYLAVHQNTIISIQLRSASLTEDVQSTGVFEMANRVQRARDLVDAKCGTRPENSAPSIYLETDNGLSLQAQMASGKIRVGAYDADGSADLDWNTFRLSVAGIDKTAHALQVVNKLSAEGRVAYIASLLKPNEVAYELRVDPKRLMTDHNFFNIAWNGDWPVQLKICDRKGACGEWSQSMYFGPFLYLRGFFDNRCLGITGADGDFRFGGEWGNNGYEAMSQFYVGLSNSKQSWEYWTTDYWTLAIGGMPPFDFLYWYDWTYGILPVFVKEPVFLDTGVVRTNVELRAPPYVFRKPNAQRYDLSAGTYSLVYGAVDLNHGVYLIKTESVVLCQVK